MAAALVSSAVAGAVGATSLPPMHQTVDPDGVFFEGYGSAFYVPGQKLKDNRAYPIDGGHAVVIWLDEEDTRRFADLTGEMIGKPLAMWVCRHMVTRPIVRARIDSGTAIIPMPSAQRALALVAALRGEAECPDMTE